MLQLHWTCADIKMNEELKKRLLIGNKESSNIEDASLIIGLHPYLITWWRESGYNLRKIT